jgi:hypothetical protein
VPEPNVNDRIGDFRDKNGIEDGFFCVAELHDATRWTHGVEAFELGGQFIDRLSEV